MIFQNIQPFVRYARYLELTVSDSYSPCFPYDARFFYTVEGSAAIRADGAVCPMTVGNALILNAGVEYTLLTPEKYVRYIVFNFDYSQQCARQRTPVPPAAPEDFERGRLFAPTRFEDCDSLNRVLFLRDISRSEKKIKQIVKEYEYRLRHFELNISCLLTELLIDCVRSTSVEMLPDSALPERVLNYIHQNWTQPLTNREIGSIFHLHPNYISTLVKAYTGMPLHQYILHLRILHAVDMLDRGNCSVKAVAQACGFCDIYYFSRYFKQITGLTPSEYRKA